MRNGHIAFFGSSLLSAYWNGAATYYRGILKYLHHLGYTVDFYEPDAFDRQRHRDIEEPYYARSIVYQPESNRSVRETVRRARDADIIVKASGVGVFDELLAAEVLDLKHRNDQRVIYWDVDAPATLSEVEQEPNHYFRELIPEYDMVFTYGGGPPVIERYTNLGANDCIPIYNALDPDTHFPTKRVERYYSTLNLLANRLPDREERIYDFFFQAADALPHCTFLLGGSGWDSIERPNVRWLGHVSPAEHNTFNSSPLAVLNVSRESMVANGYSPATRIFEAAGSAACIITDDWKGLEQFLAPGVECLSAENGIEVAEILRDLSPIMAKRIGKAARERVLSEHTYAQRAEQVDDILSRSRRAVASTIEAQKVPATEARELIAGGEGAS